VGQYVGLIGGATLVGFLAERFGWRPSLWALGVAGLLISIPSYFLLPMKKCEARVENAEVSRSGSNPGLPFATAFIQLVKIPSFLVLAAAGALTAIGVWIFLNWLPLYFKEAFSLSLASAGFLGASPVNIGGVAGQMFGGMASDRVARKGAQYRMLLHGALILILRRSCWCSSAQKPGVIIVALTLHA